jgi:hypothetical protein
MAENRRPVDEDWESPAVQLFRSMSGVGITNIVTQEDAMVRQAFLNTASMFLGVMIAFMVYHVYILFQV